MLASTIQFSHNTPHKTTTTPQKVKQPLKLMWVTTREQCPRHPTMHQALINTQLDVHVLVESSFWLRCISTRLSIGGSKTIVYINHQASKNKHSHAYSTNWCSKIMLLRKEVIHPHLPVRVPCYDFVPIADPTFDSSLTSLGHWLRVLPTFMT